MTNNKTSGASKAATKRGAPRAAANRTQAPSGQGNPPQGTRRHTPGTVDDAIAKAQQGRVNVSPAKAVEMAGQLYTRGQFGQAVRVCSQIVQARPGNSDAQNILG